MPYETDERLKSYLDTNQLAREQMCLAVLATDRRFSEVRPRHPRGGRDGARDIQAVFQKDQLAFAAVGFLIQANDSTEQKKRIRKKFSEDLDNAIATELNPKVFVFMTNINLTIGEKEALIKRAKVKGIALCDIFDRERIRIELDGVDGFAIRYQYLNLPLSDAEQASFFSKWGDDIQSVIGTGFQRLEKTLDRILFLQESSEVISTLRFVVELDREYTADEIGHFRAFCSLVLKEPIHDTLMLTFGSSDRSERFSDDRKGELEKQPVGIRHGISGGQWVKKISKSDGDDDTETNEFDGILSRHSSSVGSDPVSSISFDYSNDQFIRVSPLFRMRDIDRSLFILLFSKSLAQKIGCIRIYSNGYKIMVIREDELVIDATKFEPGLSTRFTDDELADPWVRIRPSGFSSAFDISFYELTPKRLFEADHVKDGHAPLPKDLRTGVDDTELSED